MAENNLRIAIPKLQYLRGKYGTMIFKLFLYSEI